MKCTSNHMFTAVEQQIRPEILNVLEKLKRNWKESNDSENHEYKIKWNDRYRMLAKKDILVCLTIS